MRFADYIHNGVYPLFLLPGSRTFVDGSGNTVTDVFGKASPTALLGDGTTGTTFPTLKINRMFSFDGGDYIDFLDPANITFTKTQAFTLLCRCKLSTSATSKPTIIGKCFPFTGATDGEFMLIVDQVNGRFEFHLFDETNTASKTVSSNNSIVTYNDVFDIAITYDGSSSYTTSTIKTWLNSVDVTNNVATAGAFDTVIDTSKHMMLGYGDGGTYTKWIGELGLCYCLPFECSQLQLRYLSKYLNTVMVS